VRIDADRCTACGECHPYCPTGAISHEEGFGVIDADLCVECYVCLRSGVCPADAFVADVLEWPRILRHTFSAVRPVQSGTGDIDGRGTTEMKTNDVTNRYRPGEVGFTVDVGRPGLGTTLADVARIARAVAAAGVAFEDENPVTRLMTDTATGTLREDVLGERVLSCVLEFKCTEDACLDVVAALERVAGEVDTVFSVGCISRCRNDGSAPVKALLERAGVFHRPNGKTNIGLGRAEVG
jgi:NAD-dependent dihydropyrimidine dehydrogenase PreA subunit